MPKPFSPIGDVSGRLNRSATLLTVLSAAAVLWFPFCCAGLWMDLYYTENWYWEMSSHLQGPAYRCILKRQAMVALPLVATNIYGIVLFRSMVRARRSAS